MSDHEGQERELVFCHECENEWHRDEHGLTCPSCQSDFTEIIEEENDPRYDNDDDDIFDSSSQHPFHDHNPWASDPPDPDEGDIDRVEYSTGPGGVTFTRVIYRSNPNEGFMGPGTQNNPLLQNFQTMLQGMMGPQFARNQPATQQGGPQAHPQAGAGAGSNDGQQPGHREGDGAHNPQQQHQWQGVHQAPGIRIGYNARLYPRDANNPQPQQEPFGGLQDVLGALFQQINDASQPQAGGGNGPGAGPANPLAAILASMFNPAAAAHGDAVYTQEALDRVISQLMEQNATGNAPGPATEEAIAALPKKKVDQSMLDESTGTADCSICMDPVEIGSDVTVLPCRHWFHEQCIGAWLGEHDTCPHCRKGIMPKEGEGEGNGHGQGAVRTPGQEPANSQPSATSPWPEAAPPEGSRTNPISIGSETGSPPPPAPASVPGIQRHGSVPATEHASGSGEGHSGGGGLGSRVRGWFSGSNHSQSP